MPIITRTETDTTPVGTSFEKLILASAGKRFASIKINDLPEPFTNNKEHTAIIAAGSDDVTIEVCEEADLAPPPPVLYTVTVTSASSVARIQQAAGGTNLTLPQTFTLPAGTVFNPTFLIDPPQQANFNLAGVIITSNTPNTALTGVAGQKSLSASFLITGNMTIRVDVSPVAVTPMFWVDARVKNNVGGTVSPSSQQVPSGGNGIPITYTPAAGWRVKGITRNGFVFTFGLNLSGGTIPVQNITAYNIYEVEYEPISTTAAQSLFWYASSRLTGSATQATMWEDSTYINATPIARRVFKNGVRINPFTMPYNYDGSYLRSEVDFSISETSIDEYFDNLSNNYLRLAINFITFFAGNLSVQTRINNVHGNSNNGFLPSQVQLAQLKITSPTGVVSTFNHTVPTGAPAARITDIVHSIPTTQQGKWTIEVECRLTTGTRTSYGKGFFMLSA